MKEQWYLNEKRIGLQAKLVEMLVNIGPHCATGSVQNSYLESFKFIRRALQAYRSVSADPVVGNGF